MLLALDTASSAVSVALHDGTQVVAAAAGDPSPRHAELLAPLIEQVLAAAGVDRTAVTRIAVGVGPGPFTGLRVGLVTARVLGLALGVPVIGVCSLDALAAGVLRASVEPPGGSLLIATDARRREVYWARYRPEGGRWARVAGPAVDTPDVVRSGGEDDVLAAGRGVLLYPQLLPTGTVLPGHAPLDPQAGDLAAVALGRSALVPGAALGPDPLYLRRPDAQEPGARKRVLR